jgi:hypothetical protein
MAVSSVKTRLEALEQQAHPATTARLDLSALADEDLAFIESIGPRCETQDGKPDLSKLTIPELRRLHDLVERCAHEPS